MKSYICPMHPEVTSDKLGRCPKCAMDLVEASSQKPAARSSHGDHHAMMEEDFKRRFFVTLPLVIIVLLLSPHIQSWLGISFALPGHNLILFLLASVIVFYGGLPFYQGAKSELATRNFGMMTLVALAITVGYLFSVGATFFFPGESLYWEISTLIAAFLFGHWLEMRAVAGTTGALSELAKLIPATAHKIRSAKRKTQSAKLETVDVKTEELVVGDVVLVKPGEKIPIDGVVIDGESSVNESMITGESRPIGKKKGDMVIGGSINNDGSLTVQVNKTGSETALAQIMDLIREAQSSKPKVAELADRAANTLTLIAIAAGVGTFVFWFFINPQGAIFAATLSVAVVVVACPHALGLAIPTVTTITSTLGAKNGILIKDMKGLEIARKLDYVVFDKTGTLTKGEFGVANVILSETKDLSRMRGANKLRDSSPAAQNDILSLAAAVENHSQHSLAVGIVNEAKNRKLKIPSVKNFKSYPGKGAQGLVDGKLIIVGNKTLMEEQGIKFPISNFQFPISKGATPVYVALRQAQGKLELAGVIALADVIREESKETIRQLHAMDIKTAMLTGDTEDVAQEVGKELGIDTIFSQVLPEDKVNKIKELQNKDYVVAMVGDGVNDAPSLAQAHVGIAIGAGTDVAIESAEIVLVKNDPRVVVKAIALSRKTNAKLVQNLAWATGYNVLAIPAAAGVFAGLGIFLRPEWAALLMSASSIIVVFNALLLKKEML